MNKLNLLFRGALIAAVLFYVFFVFRFFSIGHIGLTDQDEIFYYYSSKVFSEFNSLKASYCDQETVSKIGEFDWYGPAYSLVFGTFRKLSGNSDKSFIQANLLFIGVVLFFILKKLDVERGNKIWLLAVFFLNPGILNYTFYFMPIILDLLFATFLLLFIQKINKVYVTGRPIIKLSLLYIFFCLLISLFKQNFILFSFAVLPFSKNTKQFILYTGLIFISFFSTIMYGSFFIAPAFGKSLMSVKYFIQLDFINFFKNVSHYVYRNLSYIIHGGGKKIPFLYIPVYYLNVLMPITTTIFAIKSKNKLLFSIGAATFSTLIFYIAFYNLHWYFFVRITTPLLVLNLFAVLLMPCQITKWLKPSIIVLFLLLLPASYFFISKNQDAKDVSYREAEPMKKEFAKIIPFTKGKQITTILFDTTLFVPYGEIPFALSLPLGNDEGQRIRYTINYMLRKKEKDKYLLFHKLKVDFVLSASLVQLPYPASLVEQNEYFCLYEIKK